MVVAPMSRHRAALSGVPTELNVEYYRQRASAGLIVTEGTAPSAMSRGYLFTPGLYEDAHVEGWRRVTDAVHGGGGTIFVQLMHAGRIRSEEHTSELQSLMRISYAGFGLEKKK